MGSAAGRSTRSRASSRSPSAARRRIRGAAGRTSGSSTRPTTGATTSCSATSSGGTTPSGCTCTWGSRAPTARSPCTTRSGTSCRSCSRSRPARRSSRTSTRASIRPGRRSSRACSRAAASRTRTATGGLATTTSRFLYTTRVDHRAHAALVERAAASRVSDRRDPDLRRPARSRRGAVAGGALLRARRPLRAGATTRASRCPTCRTGCSRRTCGARSATACRAS